MGDAHGLHALIKWGSREAVLANVTLSESLRQNIWSKHLLTTNLTNHTNTVFVTRAIRRIGEIRGFKNHCQIHSLAAFEV